MVPVGVPVIMKSQDRLKKGRKVKRLVRGEELCGRETLRVPYCGGTGEGTRGRRGRDGGRP